jgi:hypothetical protein
MVRLIAHCASKPFGSLSLIAQTTNIGHRCSRIANQFEAKGSVPLEPWGIKITVSKV